MLAEQGVRRFISPVFFIFQLFGLYPIDITSRRHSCFNRMLWFYSLGLAITTAIAGFFYIQTRLQICNVNVNVAIDQTMWMFALVAHVIICLEVFATIPKHRDIMQRFQNIVKVLDEHELTQTFDLAGLRRKCVFRSWASFLCITFNAAMAVLVMSKSARVDFRWIVLSGCVIHLRLLQVTTYVHFVNELLRQLQSEVAAVANIHGSNMRCMALDNCKKIYSMVGEIVLLLNAGFGWSLIAILTQNMSGVTNVAYWTVYNVYYVQQGRLFLCKSVKRTNRCEI